jgi:hypothetical protein
MTVAIISTTDPKKKAALFAADIGQLDQPPARLLVFFQAAQWQKFAQIWLKARRTVPPREGFGTKVGDYFDRVDSTSMGVTVDKGGSITFALVGKPKGELVAGLIQIEAKDFARFDATVKQLTDYFAAAPATPVAKSARAAASDKFCAQIQAIVAEAPNSFAAFRGHRTKQETSQVRPPTTVDHYAASGAPAGAIACEVRARDTATEAGLYLSNYSCEFPIAGTNKGAETQKLAKRVAGCLPGISRPMGPGLSKDGGMLSGIQATTRSATSFYRALPRRRSCSRSRMAESKQLGQERRSQESRSADRYVKVRQRRVDLLLLISIAKTLRG